MSDKLAELMPTVLSALDQITDGRCISARTWEVTLESRHTVRIHEDSVSVNFVMSLGKKTQRSRYKIVALLDQYQWLSASTNGLHIISTGCLNDVCAVIEFASTDVNVYSLLGILTRLLEMADYWKFYGCNRKAVGKSRDAVLL